MTTFIGEGVGIFRAATIATGLRLYAKTGMKPNRAYTPSAMLKAANEILGRAGKQAFKRGQYVQAADALTIWVADRAPAARERGEIIPDGAASGKNLEG